jgi:hypothetical protein
MDRETLKARHRATLTRYHRALIDAEGTPPDGLLAELAAIADDHADLSAMTDDEFSRRMRKWARIDPPAVAALIAPLNLGQPARRAARTSGHGSG